MQWIVHERPFLVNNSKISLQKFYFKVALCTFTIFPIYFLIIRSKKLVFKFYFVRLIMCSRYLKSPFLLF